MKITHKNELVSATKGFGIIIVVLGHCVPSFMPILSPLISSFHMPLFFYLSGYFFKQINYICPKQYIVKKVCTLYWIALKWTIPFLLFHNIFVCLGIYNENYGESILPLKELLWRCFTVLIALVGTDVITGGVWFIRDLFIACCYLSILGFVLNRFVCKDENRIMAILFVISFLTSLTGFALPKGVLESHAFLAATMICIGYFIKQLLGSKIQSLLKCNKSNIIVATICFVLLVLSASFLPFMSMFSAPILIVPFIIISLIGLTFSISFSCFLMRVKVFRKYLIYIGENTIYIYMGHFYAFKIVSLLIISVLNLDYKLLGNFWISEYPETFVFYLIGGVALPLIFAELYKKYITPYFDLDAKITYMLNSFVK